MYARPFFVRTLYKYLQSFERWRQGRTSIKWYLISGLLQLLQGHMERLDESQINESTKDKVDHFLNSYGKVKSNLAVLNDGCTYYWTVYPILQIVILVNNCLKIIHMPRELYHLSKVGITLHIPNLKALLQVKLILYHFLSLWGHS